MKYYNREYVLANSIKVDGKEKFVILENDYIKEYLEKGLDDTGHLDGGLHLHYNLYQKYDDGTYIYPIIKNDEVVGYYGVDLDDPNLIK